MIRKAIDEINAILRWRLRNILIDPGYIFKWEVLPKLKRRPIPKELVQTDKIPVAFITYNRPHYFLPTLESFIEKNEPALDRFLIYIIVQGKHPDPETNQIVDRFSDHIHEAIYPGANLGVAGGYARLMKPCLETGAPYIIHIQDDFITRTPLYLYLDELITCLENHPDMGFVRLRSIKDRVNDYNIISRRKIRSRRVSPNIIKHNGHFTFNPTITRTEVIRRLIPSTKERDIMKKYQMLGLNSGQLLADSLVHIGDMRVGDWLK